MTTKVCVTCKEEKHIDEFRKKVSGKYGRQSKCKVCHSSWNAEYNNRPEVREKQATRRKEYNAKRYATEEGRALQRQRCKRHYYNNTQQYRARDYRRRKAWTKSTPSWLTQDQLNEMKSFYWLAADLKLVSGETYHVDHIVPINGREVCGLNVPWNLQVLPWDVNISKSNKLTPADSVLGY